MLEQSFVVDTDLQTYGSRGIEDGRGHPIRHSLQKVRHFQGNPLQQESFNQVRKLHQP